MVEGIVKESGGTEYGGTMHGERLENILAKRRSIKEEMVSVGQGKEHSQSTIHARRPLGSPVSKP